MAAQTHVYLYVIRVDYGSCDVWEQVNKLLLKQSDTLWYLINDDFHPLVVSENVNAHQSHVTVSCQISRQNLHHKITQIISHKQVKRPDDSINLTWKKKKSH